MFRKICLHVEILYAGCESDLIVIHNVHQIELTLPRTQCWNHEEHIMHSYKTRSLSKNNRHLKESLSLILYYMYMAITTKLLTIELLNYSTTGTMKLPSICLASIRLEQFKYLCNMSFFGGIVFNLCGRLPFDTFIIVIV